MEPPILDPDDPSIPPHIKEQIKEAAEVMAAIAYREDKKKEEANKRKEKYNDFVKKIHIAWKGSQELSIEDKQELFENLIDETYPLIEKVSKKLIIIFELATQIELSLKDIFYMNMIIDLYDTKDNCFQSIGTIGICIGAIDSIKGIINNLPFIDIIGKLQQDKALNEFRKLQAANADTEQSPDIGDDKRSNRETGNN